MFEGSVIPLTFRKTCYITHFRPEVKSLDDSTEHQCHKPTEVLSAYLACCAAELWLTAKGGPASL